MTVVRVKSMLGTASSTNVGEDEHASAAVAAWLAFGAEPATPTAVMPLKAKRSGASVFLLVGAGSDGRGVVAKRSPIAKAVVERQVCDAAMHAAGEWAPRLLGYGEAENGRDAWIFTRYVQGRPFAYTRRDRVESGRYLRHLHDHGGRLLRGVQLPDRSPAHYRAVLRDAVDRIVAGLRNPVADRAQLALLRDLRDQLTWLDSRWSAVEAATAHLSHTLVHADFASKNVVMIESPHPQLVAIDWGTAGWGSPAVDLVQAANVQDRFWISPHLATYAGSAASGMPSAERLVGAGHAGAIFRMLAAISGDAAALHCSWIRRPMQKLQSYRSHLDHAMTSLGLSFFDRPIASHVRSVRTNADPSADELQSVHELRQWRDLAMGGASSTATGPHVISIRSAPFKAVRLLVGVGEDGGDVVAKQCRRDRADVEHHAYTHCLSPASAPLRYYGRFDEDGAGTSWLFTEDAGRRAFDPHLQRHRVLLARWLAHVHTSSQPDSVRTSLPSRAPGASRWQLRLLLERFSLMLARDLLDDAARRTVTDLERTCREIDGCWESMERLWMCLPSCFVHGDVLPKNLRVDAGGRLLAFDWELSGWGTPFLDLVQGTDPSEPWSSPDLATYAALVERDRSPLSVDALRAGTRAARILHLVAWLASDTGKLEEGVSGRRTNKIEAYGHALRLALASIGTGVRA